MKTNNLLIKSVTIVLCLLLILSMCPVVSANEINDVEEITASFYSATTDSNHSIKVDFDRNWFKHDADEYDHNIAKLSVGLTLAAFRPNLKHLEGITSMDMNLNSFLTEAHFQDLRSDDYDKDPNIYSISTVMGHQRIGEGDDAFELIAVGVCGQGYIDEWESNFSIGSGKVHDGFSRSASLVYDRVFGYIASTHLEGPFKIWISGFSRAAAVSSLTASMLSDSSVFDQKTVFAYTFATPRYVKDEDYLRYKNIYNIVGKTDPVPMVPYAEWGYERYGQTYYLPSLETDSDFNELSKKVNTIYKELTGYDFWYNNGTTDLLKTILGYLLEICPSDEIYTRCLQDKLIHIWADSSPMNGLSTLLEIANDPVLINEDTKEAANGLLNYILMLERDYENRNSVFRKWNSKATSGVNLAHFHTPELYISWLFSTDDISEIYTSSAKYSEIYIIMDSKIDLIRDNTLIETLPSIMTYNSKKQTYEVIPIEKRSVPENYDYLSYYDYAVGVVIPRDTDYILKLYPNENEGISFVELDYTVGHLIPDMIRSFYCVPPAGSDLSIRFTGNTSLDNSGESNEGMKTVFYPESVTQNGSFEEWEYNNSFKLSEIMSIRKPSYIRLYWKDAVIYSISAILVILSLILYQIVYIIGKIRFARRVKKGWLPEDAKYKALPALCVFTIFLLFLIMEFYKQLLPQNVNIITCYKVAIGVLSVLLALFGYMRDKTRLSAFILIGLVALTVADVGMTINMNIGPVIHIISYCLLSYAYIREEKPTSIQVMLWIVLSIAALSSLSFIKGEYGLLRTWAMVYVVAALLMVVTSIGMSRRVIIGSILLFISGIMVMYNVVNGQTFVSHIISLGTYYSAIVVLASSTRHRGRYINVVERVEE